MFEEQADDPAENLLVEVRSSRVVAWVVVMDMSYLTLALVLPLFEISHFVAAFHLDDSNRYSGDLSVFGHVML